MLGDIFSGLEKHGIKTVVEKRSSIFQPEKSVIANTQKLQVKKFYINDYIYTKNFIYQVCDQTFMSYVRRHGKTRIKYVAFDLRPVHVPIKPMFYDIVMCVL